MFYGRAQATLILILVSSQTKLMPFLPKFIPSLSQHILLVPQTETLALASSLPLIFVPLSPSSSPQFPPGASRTTPEQAPLLPLLPDLGLHSHHFILAYLPRKWPSLSLLLPPWEL